MSESLLSLADLSSMDRQTFTAAVGFAFEHSPWITEQAWTARPFASIGALHAAMLDVVNHATDEQRLTLMRMHPDLAGRAAIAGELTAESTREQSSAGLDRLTPEEYAAFIERNEAYTTRFGIPFIICAREHTKAGILAAFDVRLKNELADEIATAMDEVAKISLLRLEDAVTQ